MLKRLCPSWPSRETKKAVVWERFDLLLRAFTAKFTAFGFGAFQGLGFRVVFSFVRVVWAFLVGCVCVVDCLSCFMEYGLGFSFQASFRRQPHIQKEETPNPNPINTLTFQPRLPEAAAPAAPQLSSSEGPRPDSAGSDHFLCFI